MADAPALKAADPAEKAAAPTVSPTSAPTPVNATVTTPQAPSPTTVAAEAPQIPTPKPVPAAAKLVEKKARVIASGGLCPSLAFATAPTPNPTTGSARPTTLKREVAAIAVARPHIGRYRA